VRGRGGAEAGRKRVGGSAGRRWRAFSVQSLAVSGQRSGHSPSPIVLVLVLVLVIDS
jgi:hypothetical protein